MKRCEQNKVTAYSWRAQLSSEMWLGEFKECLLSEEMASKIWKFLLFSGLFLRCLVDVLEDVKKLHPKFGLEKEI